MVKVTTTIKVDPELKEKAKKMHINLSEVFDRALRTEVGLVNGLSLEYFISEKNRLESEYRALKEKYETELKMLDQRIKETKKQKEQIENIKNHPLVLESIQILRDHGLQFLDGRIRLIRTRTGFEISKAQLLEWVKEDSQK